MTKGFQVIDISKDSVKKINFQISNVSQILVGVILHVIIKKYEKLSK